MVVYITVASEFEGDRLPNGGPERLHQVRLRVLTQRAFSNSTAIGAVPVEFLRIINIAKACHKYGLGNAIVFTWFVSLQTRRFRFE